MFARRLAEANRKRRERLKAQLALRQVLEFDGQDPAGVDDDDPSISDRSRVSSWGYSNQTSRSLMISSTIFDHSAPSETSQATSLNDTESDIIRRHIPNLPKEHKWGINFKGIVCGYTLRDVDSPAR